MSVLIEGVNIIIRNATIEKKYRDGLSQYVQDVNATFCSDGHITRVGFVVAVDAARFVMDLEQQGFVYVQDDQCVDIAIVSAEGVWAPCDWLVVQRRPDGIPYCSLKGVEEGSIAAPDWWRPDDSLSSGARVAGRENGQGKGAAAARHADDRDRLQFLRKEGNVEVYFDRLAMKEAYIGRMYEDPPDMNAFTDYFKLGADLVYPYLYIVGADRQDWRSRDGRRKVEQGIHYLRIATLSDPENWPAFWYLGKTYQAVQDHAKAYSAFKSSFHIGPDQPDVCRELGRECLELGKTAEGVSIAQAAVKLCPDDAGLVCNLGLALFLNGDLQEAARAVQQSLELSPDDPIARNLLAIIAQVQSGKRKQPRTLGELQRA